MHYHGRLLTLHSSCLQKSVPSKVLGLDARRYKIHHKSISNNFGSLPIKPYDFHCDRESRSILEESAHRFHDCSIYWNLTSIRCHFDNLQNAIQSQVNWNTNAVLVRMRRRVYSKQIEEAEDEWKGCHDIVLIFLLNLDYRQFTVLFESKSNHHFYWLLLLNSLFHSQFCYHFDVY